MVELETPVLDDHLHLHPDGRGAAAAAEFARAGGTHLLVVNRPSWHFVDGVRDEGAFETAFEATIELVAAATERLPGRAWAVLGVHPAVVNHLVDDVGLDLDRAGELMATGIERAAAHVEAGRALALKSGRPHYEVDEDVWAASNRQLRRALELAAEVGCALQLHTEATDDLTEVAGWARRAGLEPHRVVKHFATGAVAGVTPSVIARSEAVDAATSLDRFLLETDFLDDPDRPGAVLGPKVVPRRSRALAEAGHEDVLEVAHVETPRVVYGIDTRRTLGA
ncbi:MAG: TatD family hydrolase [Halobacteriota archaeon]